MKIYDIFENLNVSENPFKIIKDSENPSLRVNFSPDEPLIELGSPVKINSEVNDSFSGIKDVKIYVDDILKKICNSSCNYSGIFLGGIHDYNIIAEDFAGNINASEGTFEIEETTTKSCSEIGEVCSGDEFCSEGMTINTPSGECCLSYCYSELSLPKCSEQGGTIYSNDIESCPPDKQIPASDTFGENKCCISELEINPEILDQGLKVYWSDNVGNKISGTGVGEKVKCVVIGTADDVNYEILKKNKLDKKGSLSLSNNKGVINYGIVDETGEYECSVNSQEFSDSSILKVTEAPKLFSKAKLPGFSVIHLVLALLMIYGYYLIKQN